MSILLVWEWIKRSSSLLPEASGGCPSFSSRLPNLTPRRPDKEGLTASNTASVKSTQGYLLGLSSVPHVCMHTPTQVPWDRWQVMQTHNLWNCVLIGYTTYAWSYLPKSLRKITEYHFFFLAPREKDSVITFLKFRAGITIAGLDISEQPCISRESTSNTTSLLRSILERRKCEWIHNIPEKSVFFLKYEAGKPNI